MQSGKPSRTAWAAAAHRAVHQVAEAGRIFCDPLAVRILGEDNTESAYESAGDPGRRRMRIFIAMRTRFAEDASARAIEGGVRQMVVLGAGLDTFAYRSPYRDKLRVFEVDHPATQTWKRELLACADIAIPNWLTFAPVDFEQQTLGEGLDEAGFDSSQQTFFTWLGVVPYLTEEAVWSTLGFVAGVQGGAHVVFDYANPPDQLSPEMRAYHDERAAHVESIGERWRSYFDTDNLRAQLTRLGFNVIEDLGPRQIVERYIPERAAGAAEKGGHIVRAATVRK